MKKTILITGGAGFIGLNLVNFLIKKKKYNVYVIDDLKYASNEIELKKVLSNKKFFKININNYIKLDNLIKKIKPNIIFHLAAESHVDRSIDNPKNFIETNIIGTFNLLRSSYRLYLKFTKKNKKIFKFIHISTDEVFGELGKLGKFNELSNYQPNSPYSASKASSDLLVRAWFKTYNFPTIICNSSNNYGPYQHPEKLIPNIIFRYINELPIEIYGNGKNQRDWIYVEDNVRALYKVMLFGKPFNLYTIGTGKEESNINIAKKIMKNLKNNKLFKKKYNYSSSKIKYVEDRKGHDYRYSVSSQKLKKHFNWLPLTRFDKGLEKTINWYLGNEEWMKNKLSYSYKLKRIGMKKF